MSVFSQRLKELRLKHGLTQKQMAEMLDLNERQYRRYENGESPLTAETIYNICVRFKVSSNSIIGF